MRIVCISDTHTMGKKIVVPDGDVLIHAGDHTFRGTYEEIMDALEWLDSLPHKHKLFIAGNHDLYFDEVAFPEGAVFRDWEITRPVSIAAVLACYPGLTYLQDSGVTIDNVKFYGSPWQPWFYDWAFNAPWKENNVLAQRWESIPDDVNVLITHCPPAHILDWSPDGHVSDPYLLARVQRLMLKQLSLHVFGHIHTGYGVKEELGVTFVNAAICNDRYKPINPPIVIDL